MVTHIHLSCPADALPPAFPPGVGGSQRYEVRRTTAGVAHLWSPWTSPAAVTSCAPDDWLVIIGGDADGEEQRPSGRVTATSMAEWLRNSRRTTAYAVLAYDAA